MEVKNVDQIIVQTALVQARLEAWRTDCPCHIFLDTIHHLKPTSIGGSDDESNKRKRMDYLHQAWHHVTRNYSAPMIARGITINSLIGSRVVVAVPKWWRVGNNTISPKTAVALERYLSHAGLSPSLDGDKKESWRYLFEHLDEDVDVLREINKYYIDQDYELMFVDTGI